MVGVGREFGACEFAFGENGKCLPKQRKYDVKEFIA